MKKLTFLCFSLLLLFVCALGASAANGRPYTENKTTRIVDGVVYTSLGGSWMVEDYFATDKIAKTATAIHIVPEIDGEPVTAIKDGILSECYKKGVTYLNVTEITLPDTLTDLGNACFSGLDGVKQLVIPVSVRSFGIQEDTSPFWRMDGLETIRILAPISTFRDGYFAGCRSLKKVTWKGTLTAIGQEAFFGCRSLRSFRVPETVTAIGGCAFANSGLVSVRLPAGVSYFGHEGPRGRTFANCDRLKKAVFTGPAANTAELPEEMFDGCTSLTSVTMPDEVKRVDVEQRAFRNCSSLKKLSFDSRIFFLGKEAFRGCTSLASFTIGKKHSYHITVGDHRVIKITRQIPPSAFKGCKALKKLRVLTTDPSFLWVDHRFIYNLPKNCKIYVRTANMKQAFLDKGCTNKVIVKRDLA